MFVPHKTLHSSTMSALQLYMPPAFALQLHPYHFIIAALMGILTIVLRNRCALNQMACVMDESVSGLHVEQNNLGKLVDEQSDALKKSLDALETRVFEAEVALETLRFLNHEQKIAVESMVEDAAFACEIASSAYLEGPKAGLNYMEQPLTKYLENSPATARQILDYLTENKSVIDSRFFSYGSVLTLNTVNSCLYSSLNKGRVTKNEASPPVWSVK